MIEILPIGKARRTPWDNKTSKSWLHGVEYRVLEDPDDIYDYINTAVKKELETDAETMIEGPDSNQIIATLATRKWKLETMDLCDVQLNPMILQSSDIKTGRRFKDRLKERTSELRRVLDQDRVPIWPLVLVDNHYLLIDGYCRHSTLTEMGVPRVYGYLGLVCRKS